MLYVVPMSKQYTDEDKIRIVDQALDMVTEMSLSKASNKLGVVKSTLWRWIGKDTDTLKRYARARLIYENDLYDKMIELVFEIEVATNDRGVDNGAVQLLKVQVDSIKWILARSNPSKYGDRLQLAGDKDNPLEVVHKVERVIIDSNKDRLIGDSEPGVGVEALEEEK